MPNVTTWTPEKITNNSWLPERSPYLPDLNPYELRVENDHELRDICRLVLLRISDPEFVIERVRHLAGPAFLVGAALASSLTPLPSQKSLFISFAESDFPLISSLRQELRLGELLTRLETLRHDVQDDSSSDIDWPTDQACTDAELFIRLLPLSEILSPNIYFAHDGEINFLWKRQTMSSMSISDSMETEPIHTLQLTKIRRS